MFDYIECPITYLNGVALIAYLDERSDCYALGFKPAFPREDYEEYGTEESYDEAVDFCNDYFIHYFSDFESVNAEIKRYIGDDNDCGFMPDELLGGIIAYY